MSPLLKRNRVDLLLRTEPPESRPAAGLTIVVLKLSPVIVVYGGTMIGS